MESPEFKSDEEFFAWTFKKISESLTNLAKRVEQVEEGLGKIPPPGENKKKVSAIGIIDPKTGQSWLIDATPDFASQLNIPMGVEEAH